ncbi:MAG: SWIM zinc finger domain-containing protein [Saprospiraceae bacterium]
MAKLTLDWLRNEATPASYERGGRYYHQVGAVQKTANVYQAEVAGSSTYQVNLEESSIDVHGFCSCPYSGIGVCKHIVAVGLNVLDGNYTEVATVTNEVEFSLVEHNPEAVSDHETPPDVDDFYQNVFSTAPEEQQAAFLRQLFQQQTDLQAAFSDFIQPKPTADSNYIATHEVYESIRRRLPQLEFIYESEHEIEAFRYEDDDRNADNYAEVFAPFGQKMVVLLQENDLSNALRILLGIYIATQQLEQLNWRDYPVFKDNLYDLRFPFVEWEMTAADQFKLMDIPERTAKKLLAQLFQYSYDELEEGNVSFVPADFANVFRVLTPELEAANYLLTLLDEGQYYRLENVHLYLYALEKLSETERWVETGEDFATNNPAIAKQMLQYYFTENDHDSFYRLAQITFDTFPLIIGPFLLKKVRPEYDRDLYVAILQEQVTQQNDLAAYRKLRNYLDLQERNAFIERNYLDADFYVQLLEIEQRYQDILEFVREHLHYHRLGEIVQPILQIFPAEVYEMLTQQAVEAIHHVEQTPAHFKRIAQNLRPILQIKGYEEQAIGFSKKLKKKYSNLADLVAALKAVGF